MINSRSQNYLLFYIVCTKNYYLSNFPMNSSFLSSLAPPQETSAIQKLSAQLAARDLQEKEVLSNPIPLSYIWFTIWTLQKSSYTTSYSSSFFNTIQPLPSRLFLTPLKKREDNFRNSFKYQYILASMQNNTPKKCQDRVILIYHNFKGTGQNIRILLSYLELTFSDIYLDQYENQKQTLPLDVRKILEKHPVNQNKLPAIIHEGEIIYELNQIMTYICRAFDREDLLGNTIEQKSHVCEFMEIYSHRLATNTRFLIALLDEVLSPQLEGLCLLSFLEAKLDQYFENSGYIMELTLHFLKNGGNSFIFGKITILDFYFLQAARQVIAIFGCIDEQTANQNWTEMAGKYLKLKKSMGQEIRNAHILRGLKKFHDFFISQDFYSKNEDYFEKFNIVPKRANESTIKGMEKIWAIDQKYFKY